MFPMAAESLEEDSFRYVWQSLAFSAEFGMIPNDRRI